MLKLSVTHLFITGAFLIVAVQSRICRKEVTMTRDIVKTVSFTQQTDQNDGTPRILTKSKIRHAKKTHMITYCCREEDDTEVSETECIQDCKANCMYGHCTKKGKCVCSYGFMLIKNNCVQFCDLCIQSNGTCMALMLCQCKYGSYFGKVCPSPDEGTTPSSINEYDDPDFPEIDDNFYVDSYNILYNSTDNLKSSTMTPINKEIKDIIKRLNYTHNSMGSSTPTGHGYVKEIESTRTTEPSLNVTQLTSEPDQPAATNHNVQNITTEGIINGQSNSSDLNQASAITSSKHHKGVSILISIILGNPKCEKQNTLLLDGPSND